MNFFQGSPEVREHPLLHQREVIGLPGVPLFLLRALHQRWRMLRQLKAQDRAFRARAANAARKTGRVEPRLERNARGGEKDNPPWLKLPSAEGDEGEIDVGDWVLIHVGFAISQIDEDEAIATRRLLEAMGAEYEQELAELRASVIE